jgi:DNA-binding NtrC family response regulator
MNKIASMQPVIMSILELGGYPDFSNLYQSLGFQVVMMPSMRKAIKYIKSHRINVIVAEFNFQSDFRDRSSQLETLIASIAQLPDVEVIVFFDKEHSHQLNKVTDYFDFLETLAYPVDEQRLKQLLERLKTKMCPS